MRLIDSHCHIDGPQFDMDREEVLLRAQSAGVERLLLVGTGDPNTGELYRAVTVAKEIDCAVAVVGVHPHDASKYSDEVEEELVRTIRSENIVVGWGEIGLDYHYDNSPRDIQRSVFIRQLNAARDLGVPVVIHSRDAELDTREILRRECSYGGFRGVLHCFSGSRGMAEDLMELGFYVSFSGNVTFKSAELIRDAALAVPLERMLVETDAPYLSPNPLRGKRNEPAFVTHTAEYLANLKGVDIETFGSMTTANFYRVFGMSENH